MRPRHHCVQHWRNLLSALGSVHPNTAGCLCGWEPWPNNRHVYTRPRAGSFAMAQHSPTSLSPTRTTFLATWLSAGTTPHSEPYMFLTHACDPVRTRSCTVYHAPLRVNAVGADRQGWRRACVHVCMCACVCARATVRVFTSMRNAVQMFVIKQRAHRGTVRTTCASIGSCVLCHTGCSINRYCANPEHTYFGATIGRESSWSTTAVNTRLGAKCLVGYRAYTHSHAPVSAGNTTAGCCGCVLPLLGCTPGCVPCGFPVCGK